MATAIELLRAANGERSLFGRIGRWRQFVSRQIDAILTGGAVDFATKSYGAAVDSVTQPGASQVINQLSFTTTAANEKVGLSFTADRFNAAGGGGGFYEFLIDGVNPGLPGRSPTGTTRGTMTMQDIATIASPGVHILSLRVTGNTGAETTVAFSELQAIGYGAV